MKEAQSNDASYLSCRESPTRTSYRDCPQQDNCPEGTANRILQAVSVRAARSTMRPLTLAALAAAMFSAPQALAAPTCQTARGETIRCGTEGAMPVGWTLSAGERLARPASPDFVEL